MENLSFINCVAWHVDIKEVPYCPCEMCLLETFDEMPFMSEIYPSIGELYSDLDDSYFIDADEMSSDFGLEQDPRHVYGGELDLYLVNNRPWTPTMVPLVIPCLIENHRQLLMDLVMACVSAQDEILKSQTQLIRYPKSASKTMCTATAKNQLLKTSIKLYDAQFVNYNGPLFDTCPCPELQVACGQLQKLADTCTLAGVPLDSLWSFAPYSPKTNYMATY